MEQNKYHNQENHLHSQDKNKQFQHPHNLQHEKNKNLNKSDKLQNKHETEILYNLNKDEHHPTIDSQKQHIQDRKDKDDLQIHFGNVSLTFPQGRKEEEEFKNDKEKQFISNPIEKEQIKNQYDYNEKERQVNKEQSTVDHLQNYQPEKPLINQKIELRYEHPSESHIQQVKNDFSQNLIQSQENRDQCTVDHLSTYQPEKPLINETVGKQNIEKSHQQVKENFNQNLNEQQQNKNQNTVDHLSSHQPPLNM